ncbi:glycerophosphodiester phosphodiesterase [Paenibacillus thalictri]|nr:glycerophosphodiester phosphodiesterase family protein [Paenibacillus thalictri]
MVLIAHRGGTDKYPELTIDAARHSLEHGADYVEMDIRFTKDGVPVISHDDDALKLFGNSALIADLTAEQFVALNYVSDPSRRPHTLEEVLASGVGPILFHIKEGGEQLARILAFIRIHRYEEKVVMGVMSGLDAKDVKMFDERIRVLAFMPSKDQALEFIDSGADIIRLWEEWVNEELVRFVQQSGKQVWIMAGSSAKGTTGYTSPEQILSWKQMGVNGVLVDKIEETKVLL